MKGFDVNASLAFLCFFLFFRSLSALPMWHSFFLIPDLSSSIAVLWLRSASFHCFDNALSSFRSSFLSRSRLFSMLLFTGLFSFLSFTPYLSLLTVYTTCTNDLILSFTLPASVLSRIFTRSSSSMLHSCSLLDGQFILSRLCSFPSSVAW